MNTQRNHDHLSRRDQWWLDLGLALGNVVRRILHREGAAPGTPYAARHHA
ncbi:hypothetical protein [Mesorhizobium xinjiangense]|nr:hypothetical protein [Mesorhizobium xinjiangense]